MLTHTTDNGTLLVQTILTPMRWIYNKLALRDQT